MAPLQYALRCFDCIAYLVQLHRPLYTAKALDQQVKYY